MNCTILEVFRHDLYHECFKRARDALFDLTDALLTDPLARSFVELSQAASFQRHWPSLYAALQDGQIDHLALSKLYARMLPQRLVGSRLVLGLDTSPVLRPYAHTAPDRTFVHRSNLPKAATPVAPGWQFSTLVVLPEPVSSWTYILDSCRVPSTQTATTIGVAQLAAVLPRLRRWGLPLLLLDRHYSNTPWVLASATLATDQLIRARSDQVLYRPPPPPSGRRGRPRLDGARFQGSDPSTHHEATADWQGLDEDGQGLQVTLWANLHLKRARQVAIAVVRIIRQRARGSKRDPRVSWFWWLGGEWPELAEIPKLYGRRFGQEHGYRFDKQDLLWTQPRVRTPEQCERWTDLVSIVHNQLVLARPYVEGLRQPWERTSRAATPRQVRRAMGRIIGQLGTPARPPLRRGKSPGRAQGAEVKRAPPQPVIRKVPPKARSKQKTISKRNGLRQ